MLEAYHAEAPGAYGLAKLPPSSFNAKRLASTMSPRGGDMDRLRSASDIRAEIRLIEAEEQRVIATFSFLEQQQRETTAFSAFPSSSKVYYKHKLSLSGTRTAFSPSIMDEIFICEQRSIRTRFVRCYDHRWTSCVGKDIRSSGDRCKYAG